MFAQIVRGSVRLLVLLSVVGLLTTVVAAQQATAGAADCYPCNTYTPPPPPPPPPPPRSTPKPAEATPVSSPERTTTTVQSTPQPNKYDKAIETLNSAGTVLNGVFEAYEAREAAKEARKQQEANREAQQEKKDRLRLAAAIEGAMADDSFKTSQASPSGSATSDAIDRIMALDAQLAKKRLDCGPDQTLWDPFVNLAVVDRIGFGYEISQLPSGNCVQRLRLYASSGYTNYVDVSMKVRVVSSDGTEDVRWEKFLISPEFKQWAKASNKTWEYAPFATVDLGQLDKMTTIKQIQLLDIRVIDRDMLSNGVYIDRDSGQPWVKNLGDTVVTNTRWQTPPPPKYITITPPQTVTFPGPSKP